MMNPNSYGVGLRSWCFCGLCVQVVNRSKIRVVKMLIVVVVVFAFCWLPLYAVNVRIYLCTIYTSSTHVNSAF